MQIHAVILWVLCAAVPWHGGTAAPFVPQDIDQVLERLPYNSVDPLAQELRRLRTALANAPHNLEMAVRLARRYIEVGRAEADPRYYGYAQAALGPWWEQGRPPPQVLVLRAILRQNRHDFEGALEDLTRVLKVQPRNAQAWLSRAVILTVRGDYTDALRSCLPLSRLTNALLTSACISNAASRSGQAEKAYQLLHQALQNNPLVVIEERLWALTVLARIAARLGNDQAAEQHFKQALDLRLRDAYLLSAYADFLLDQDRPKDVRTLLKEDIRPDGSLLRVALAEQRLGLAPLERHVEDLRARFAAARMRSDNLHLGNEARFTLHLLKKPAEALQLALRNWAVQREPIDARLVLEAALAAGNPEAAQPVLNYLAQTGLEDVRLTALTQRLGEMPP